MFRILHNVKVDWLGKRRIFLYASALLLLAGLGSAATRQFVKGGTDAFNLGVDFKGGTLMNVRFKQRPSEDEVRTALAARGVPDAQVQSTENPDELLVKLARQGSEAEAQAEAQVDPGRVKAAEALKSFGPEVGLEQPYPAEGNAFRIERTEAVGEVAGEALRNQAVAVTLLALVGVLLYIAFRFEWTYGAAAVLTVFHDVLVTLGFFSIFQWEVNLTVISALLTLVGFSVNDTIVTFDRIRENLRLHRRASLYDITNEAINQTLSRTVITAGTVFFTVLALVVFGGDVLRGFSLALFIGIIVGTYSTIAIASPIMVWWQQRLEGRTVAPAAGAGASSAAQRGGAAQPRPQRTRAAASGRSQRAARP